MPDEKNSVDAQKIIKFKRLEDLVTTYANNVFFETSVFDIKMTFGELSQPMGETPFVEQHTAITLPWLQAKVVALLLTINVAAHEKKFGTISIPDGILPSTFQKTSEEGQLALPKLMELIEDRPPLKADSPVPETKQ